MPADFGLRAFGLSDSDFGFPIRTSDSELGVRPPRRTRVRTLRWLRPHRAFGASYVRCYWANYEVTAEGVVRDKGVDPRRDDRVAEGA
jgi:hypothetical protein